MKISELKLLIKEIILKEGKLLGPHNINVGSNYILHNKNSNLDGIKVTIISKERKNLYNYNIRIEDNAGVGTSFNAHVDDKIFETI